MITVKHLTKKYGPVTAVDDISFTVEAGHIYGFLGPNGAGKSTTMNMLTGCLAPTAGEIAIAGHDVYSDAIAAKRHIGYLPEQPPLYMDMTPFEFLSFVGRAKGLRGEALYHGIEQVMEKTGITDVAGRLCRNLSKGYKQRVGIAQAILGEPDIVILDEPTVGLDPIQILEIRELIRELGENHTVILSSHILQEISAVCDHVIMISHGKIVADASMEQLLASGEQDAEAAPASARCIRLETEGDADAVEAAISAVPGVASVSVECSGNRVTAVVETAADADPGDEIFLALRRAGLPVHSMTDGSVASTASAATLEEVFVRLAGERLDSEESTEEAPEDCGGIEPEEPLEESGTYQPLFSDTTEETEDEDA